MAEAEAMRRCVGFHVDLVQVRCQRNADTYFAFSAIMLCVLSVLALRCSAEIYCTGDTLAGVA